MSDLRPRPLNGFALVLGASSGFGEPPRSPSPRRGWTSSASTLDRRATTPHVEEVVAKVRALGRGVVFNSNAADDGKRQAVLDAVDARLAERGGRARAVLLHCLAFGSLRPALPGINGEPLTRMQVEMTLDVMSSSLVYWTRDPSRAGTLGEHGRVLAMTTRAGATRSRSTARWGPRRPRSEAWVRQLTLGGAWRSP